METLTSAQIFAVLGIVLMILEIVVPGFVMMPMGVAFLITAAFANVVIGLGAQLGVLFVSLIFTFFFFSKVIRPKMQKDRFLSNADGLKGQVGTVEEEINPSQNKGYIKIYGDSWRAITLDGSIVPVGARVKVERLDGNKVFVSRV
jgi:membrane protein implicated in regulation of membrane protease activity